MTGIGLAHALCNSSISYCTSFAARLSQILFGEYIHKLFKLPVRKADAQSLADEAVIRLNYDHNRRTLLKHLQVLILEEVSLLSAQLFCAMDLVLRKIRQIDESLGGVLIIANGDCCQLSNISGYNIFETCCFMFTFDHHFLAHFVRMLDPDGQRLLKMMEVRPIELDSIDEIKGINSSKCNFVEILDDLTSQMIMKVFGKREAERKALQHFSKMERRFGTRTRRIFSLDEIKTDGSHCWKKVTGQVCSQNVQLEEFFKKIF